MVDKVGKELKVGDYIAFNPQGEPSNWLSNFYAVGTVIDIREANSVWDAVVTISCPELAKTSSYHNCHWGRNSCECVKVGINEAMIWKLSQ